MLTLKSFYAFSRGALLFIGLTASNLAFTAEAKSFGEIAGNLLSGAILLTDFLHAVCLALGIGFVIYSFVTYQTHRQNPKLMPLDRPIIYLVLGLVLIAIPFLDYLLGQTGSGLIHKMQ